MATTPTELSVIGIDPGVGGGIAILGPTVAHAYPMPATMLDICERIKSLQTHCLGRVFAVIERNTGYVPGSQATASQIGRLMQNYGRIEGAVAMSGVPYKEVNAGTWQAKLGVKGIPYDKRKRKLREIAQKLFPKLRPTAKTCDAILIAMWGCESKGISYVHESTGGPPASTYKGLFEPTDA